MVYGKADAMTPLSFMTREVFDGLILLIILIGLIAAALRLRADFTRPLPGDPPAFLDAEDTQPIRKR